METYMIYIPFALYLVYILYKLYIVSKNKGANTSLKFSKGKNNYSSRIIFLTLLATMIGPGYSYGAIDTFYEYGVFYALFFLLAIVQFWITGHFFVGKIKSVGANKETTGDILGQAYGKPAQILTGILTILFSVAIVALLGAAGGKVLCSISEIPLNLAIILIISFITLYSFYGGIATVIKTDNIQFILICIFAAIGVIAGIIQLVQSNNVQDIPDFIWNTNNMSTTAIIGTAIAFFLGEAFLPVYVIRGFISNDSTSAVRAFKRAAYFGLIWFIVLSFIGISAHLVNHNTELSYLSLITETYYGHGGLLLIGIAIAGMISVVMSTLDSILNAAGVSFRKDIIEQMFKINEDQKLSYSRLAIFLISALGAFVTVFSQNIVGLLIWAYSLWVPVIVFPLAYYLLKGKVRNRKSGIFGIIFGFTGWMLFEFIIPTAIPAILIGLILNATVLLTMEHLSNNENRLS